MIGFLTGAAAAVLLAVVTWVGMETLYVPTEIRYGGPQLHLSENVIEETVGGQ